MGVKAREWKGSWWVFVNHKGQRKTKKCASKKLAELVRDETAVRLRQGQHVGDALADATPVPRSTTFADYAEHWITTLAPLRVRPSTLEQYALRLRLRLLSVLGPLQLTEIKREHVRTLVGAIMRQGNLGASRAPGAAVTAPSRATVRATIRTLSAILASAEDAELITGNPAHGMGRYITADATGEVDEIEIFERDELARVLDVAARDFEAFYPFVLLLARTGMRLGEAIAIEWRDVDLRARSLHVRRSERRGRMTTPKSGKARHVEMSGQLADVLRGLQSFQAAEAAVAGREPGARVFTTPDGRTIHAESFRRAWTAILRRAHVRYRKPHALRHTYASLLLSAGQPVTYVQAMLGHHSAAFTLTVYGHAMPREWHHAVDMLDDATPAAICNPAATEAGGARVTP